MLFFWSSIANHSPWIEGGEWWPHACLFLPRQACNIVKTTITLQHKCWNVIYTTQNKTLQILVHLNNKDSISFATWLWWVLIFTLFFADYSSISQLDIFHLKKLRDVTWICSFKNFQKKVKYSFFSISYWKLYFSLIFRVFVADMGRKRKGLVTLV